MGGHKLVSGIFCRPGDLGVRGVSGGGRIEKAIRGRHLKKEIKGKLSSEATSLDRPG